MTTTSLLPDVGIELREGYAEVGDQRVFESSPPTRVATTCHRSQRTSRTTPSTCSPPTSAASSENSVPSPRSWPVTTGAEALPGPPR
jgi:hypothetical protein